MKKQRGMTLIGWTIVLAIIAFFATVAMRLIPMYQEYFSVVQIMESMKIELTENKLTKQQVKILFEKRFNTKYVSSVKSDNMNFIVDPDNYSVNKVVIDYEVGEAFIAQISLVGHFHKEIEVEEPKGT
jgi:Tfp pilus assembly major pilin PilA